MYVPCLSGGPTRGTRRALYANVKFGLVWLALAAYCRLNFYDDPTSFFHSPARAYETRYSRQRVQEAEEYLRALESQGQDSAPSLPASATRKRLCIGVPSVNRTSESFLTHTLTTLVDKITPEARESIHIVVLLANKSPKDHFAYGQPWLPKLADEVLVYGNPSDHRESGYRAIDYNVNGGRRGTGRVENMRLDHSVLVEACRDSSADYFALVEDDVVAAPNWFVKLQDGLQYVEKEAARRSVDWIYLRMFYSEIFMGWNAEEWPSYSKWIFSLYTAALVLILAARRYANRRNTWNGAAASNVSNNYIAASALVIWLPATIALYFMAGRASLHAMNPFRGGVREMPRYGCCAQGLVFPARQLKGVQDLFRNPPYEFAGDQILEGYAGNKGFSKWALDPSVLQHVGSKQSSSGQGVSEVWNFSFERQHGS